MCEEKTIVQYYHPELLDELQAILNGDVDNDIDGRLERFTAVFGNDVEVDVNVIGVPDEPWGDGGDVIKGNSYVDAILFLDGMEQMTLDVSDEIEGEHHFFYNDVDYTFIIKRF